HPRHARVGGPDRAAEASPQPVERRPEAARGHRPRVGEGAGTSARRRAHREPRQPYRCLDHRSDAPGAARASDQLRLFDPRSAAHLARRGDLRAPRRSTDGSPLRGPPMMLIKIAFRNILRNSRRSLMTMSAIAVGVTALVLFGEFVGNIVTGLQTQTVRQYGHLTVFRSGYFNFGAGNPGAYGISDYQSVIRLIKEDPVLAPRVSVVTPTVKLFGIAANFDVDASKTFFGEGVVPSDRDRMRRWDEYRILEGQVQDDSGLRDNDETRGVVGAGLARVLGLCE